MFYYFLLFLIIIILVIPIKETGVTQKKWTKINVHFFFLGWKTCFKKHTFWVSHHNAVNIELLRYNMTASFFYKFGREYLGVFFVSRKYRYGNKNYEKTRKKH